MSVIVRLGKKGASVSFSDMFLQHKSNLSFILSSIKKTSFENRNIYILERQTIISLFRSLSKIIKFLRKNNEPILILMSSPLDLIIYLFSKKGTPIYLIIHDDKTHLGEDSIKEKINVVIWKRFLPNIITLSNFVANSLINQNFKVKSIAFHPYFPLAEKYTNVKKEYDYGIFGRMKEYQGKNNFYEIINSIVDLNKTVILCGNLGQDFDFKHPRVTIINEFVSDEKFFSEMAKTRTVILPYLEATQSGIIPNALLLDCKIITTDVGGIREQDLYQDFVYLEEINGKYLSKKLKESSLNHSSRDPNLINNISPEVFVTSILGILSSSKNQLNS